MILLRSGVIVLLIILETPDHESIVLKTATAATMTTLTTKLQPKKRGDGSGITGFAMLEFLEPHRHSDQRNNDTDEAKTKHDAIGIELW